MTLDEILNLEHSMTIRYYFYDIELYSTLRRGVDVKKFAIAKDSFIANEIVKKTGYNPVFDKVVRDLFVYIPSITCKNDSIDRMLCIDEISMCLTFINEAKCLEGQDEIQAIGHNADYKYWDNKEYVDAYRKELIDKTKELLRKQKQLLNDCKTKEDFFKLNIYKNTYSQLVEKYIEEGFNIDKAEEITLSKIKEGQITSITSMLGFLKYAMEAVPLEFSDEIKKMIDPIKLGMLVSLKSMLNCETVVTQEESDIDFNKFNLNGIYAYWFYKYLMKHPEIVNSYKNTSIEFIGGAEVNKITLKEFIEKFEDYYKNNMSSKLMLDPNTDLGSNISYLEFDNIFEKRAKERLAKSEIRAAVTDWEIIKNGTLDEERERTKRQLTDYTKRVRHHGKREQTLDVLIDKWEYFDSTNYITTLEGTNKMSGYVGYIYPNGCVSFEQFWSEKDNSVPAIDKAIYIMDITNFLKLSQLSKTEIMKYIKNSSDNSVRRIYHRGDWKLRHSQELEKRKSTKEKDKYLMSFIDMLREKGKEEKNSSVKITTIDINNCMKTIDGVNIKEGKDGIVFDHNLNDENNNNKLLLKGE